jgi:hypothetical protein
MFGLRRFRLAAASGNGCRVANQPDMDPRQEPAPTTERNAAAVSRQSRIADSALGVLGVLAVADRHSMASSGPSS